MTAMITVQKDLDGCKAVLMTMMTKEMEIVMMVVERHIVTSQIPLIHATTVKTIAIQQGYTHA